MTPTPSHPTHFDSGLFPIQISQYYPINSTYSCCILTTDFPESMTEDKRLFLKTSGLVSSKTCLEARYLSMRPRQLSVICVVMGNVRLT